MRILAKSGEREETLKEHTDRALSFLTKWFRWQRVNVTKTYKIAGISRNELESMLFATVYLHDIGKTGRGFQEQIRGGSRGTPHALLSLPFIIAAVPPMHVVNYEALAVMSHHTPFHSALYNQYYDMSFKDRYYLKEALKFYNQLSESHGEHLKRPYPFPLKVPNLTIKAKKLLEDIKNIYLPPPKVRLISSLFNTAVRYSDWLASGHHYDYKPILYRMRRPLRKSMIKKGFTWYGHQLKAGEVKGNVFIRIPTGKGKTEGVLLWAGNNWGGKVLYLLPTRVTSNAMYTRMVKIYGEPVGISHGTASLQIVTELEERGKEGWGSEEFIGKKLLSSTFMKPLVVATVDQLLLAKFNWRQWETMEQNCVKARIIFDEIHSYDLYTTALIVNTVEELKGSGAKFAFMSATFPNFIKDALEEILGETPLIQEEKYDKMCRHRINYLQEPIEQAIPHIIADYNAGKKVLVILNTVKKSVDIYRLLKEQVQKEDILLYHSRFIEMHRRVKEKTIHDKSESKYVKPFIAVTTQVVEVSLDIDLDVLYTELAPVDALAQRMGRVNRYGLKGIANIYIYEPSMESDFVYGLVNLTRAHKLIEKINGENLTEGKLKILVEKQYPKETMLKMLSDEVEKVKANMNQIRFNLWRIQTLPLSDEFEAFREIAITRRDDLPSIQIIPLAFKETVEKLKHRGMVTNYTVRVHLHNVAKHLEVIEHRTYANIDYDEEFGATF